MLQAQLAQQGGYANGYGGGETLGGYYGAYGGFGAFWPWGGASVFGVPGFGRGARRGFGERGFEHRHGGAGNPGNPGNHSRGSAFEVPRGHAGFRSSLGTARGTRGAGRR
jgi:hypothetical protein